jgi:hypothetical protein
MTVNFLGCFYRSCLIRKQAEPPSRAHARTCHSPLHYGNKKPARSGFLRTHCGPAFRNSSFGDTAAARRVAQHRKKTTSVFYGKSDDVGEREKAQKALEKKNAEVLHERFSKAVITKMDTTAESLTTKIDTTAAALTTKIDTTAEALTTKINTMGSCQSTHHKDRHTLRRPSCHILSHFVRRISFLDHRVTQAVHCSE